MTDHDALHDALARLATATLKLFDRERLVHGCRDLIDSLEQYRLDPLLGERKLLDEATQRLDTAFGLLRSLPGEATEEKLKSLEAQVDDVTWDAAAALQPELTDKHRQRVAFVGGVATQLNAWDIEVAELEKVVDGARLDGTPLGPLEEELKAVHSRLASLRSAMTQRLYGDLQKQHDSAQQTFTSFAARVHDAEKEMPRLKALARQADLLIMNTGLDMQGRYVYQVLLRSADRTQRRGINIIQAMKRLNAGDRDNYVAGGLVRLTQSINSRLRSSHALQQTADAAPTVLPGDGPAVTPPPDVGAAMRELGRFMWGMVIPRPMQELLSSQNWSLSITTNDLEVPWELLCFDAPVGADAGEDQFLCLSKSVSRMPLGDAFPQPVRRRRRDASQRRRMLLVHSDPDDNLPAAAGEVATIAEQLRDRLDIVSLNPRDATNNRFIQALGADLPFDFIHYAGHAVFDAATPGNSGLQLKDGLFDAEKIRNLNRGGSLVFLNACESGVTARASEPQQVSYLLSKPVPVVGLASAFIYSGALGCVGSLWSVYDQAAAELAVKFYRFVLDGEPTGEALRRARADIRKAYPEGSTWAAYVLYGDPTYRLDEF